MPLYKEEKTTATTIVFSPYYRLLFSLPSLASPSGQPLLLLLFILLLRSPSTILQVNSGE